ncbi:hypothetical protein WA158_000148 [Blastocystis sp. Blastoise]
MTAAPEEQGTMENLIGALASINKDNQVLLAAIEKNDIETVIKTATSIASVLRSSDLSPKDYYEVWMKVSESLSSVESYFTEAVKNGRYPLDLFESAQYIPHIIPRLYFYFNLTGSICIKTEATPCKNLLYDLIDMCKGVQHPTRGLFLRNYFITMAKDKLPDVGTVYEGKGGNINDCIDILLRNFNEMNRLWIRMQSGSAKKRPQREQERRDLRVLVGGNILVLSQLEGLDEALYSKAVLPKLLKEIVDCQDTIAQQYFMDCIINAFPDDFHLVTLNQILECLPKLNSDIDISVLLNDLLNRLVSYAEKQKETDCKQIKDLSIFKAFGDFISSCLSSRPSLSMSSIIEMCTYILSFIILFYGTKYTIINDILGWINEAFKNNNINVLDAEAGEKVVNLLSLPMNKLALDVLKLSNFPELMTHLNITNSKQVSNSLLLSILKSDNIPITKVEDLALIDSLYTFLKPLLEDSEGEESTVVYDEQVNVSKLTYKFICEGDLLYKTIQSIYHKIQNGGNDRLYVTLPPLLFRLYTIIYDYETHPLEDITLIDLFKYISVLLGPLMTSAPSIAIKLHLETAAIADAFNQPDMCYELLSQACLLFEENPVSRAQITWLPLLISTLYKCVHIDKDLYDSLCSRINQYCNSLLKKEDKNYYTTLSICLYLKDYELNEKTIDTLLAKCIRLYDMSTKPEEQTRICLDILNCYIYMNSVRPDTISKEKITLLLENIEKSQNEKKCFENEVEHLKQLLA